MKFNFNEVYQIESGVSQKKIYRFKNSDKEGVFVDFSYNNNVFIPVWEGDDISPPDGYIYVETPDMNGRIGAYVDIT